MTPQEQDRLLLKIYRPFAVRMKSEINRYIKTISDNFDREASAIDNDRYISEHMDNINKIWQFYAKNAIQEFGSRTKIKIKNARYISGLEFRIEAPKGYKTFYDYLFSQWVHKEGGQKITNIARTTQKNIRDVIQRESQNEFSTQQIAKKILEVKSFTTFRAKTIALTETHNAAQYASEETARKLGDDNELVVLKSWIPVQDERTRQTHAEMEDHEPIPLNQDFDVPTPDGGTEQMSRPGDPKGSPENVIRCRCALVYESE